MLVYRKFKKVLHEQEELIGFLITNRTPKTSPTRIEAEEKLTALHELNVFVESYEWVKTKGVLEKVKLVIQNNFNYNESAKQLNTTPTTLRVMFSRCDNNLKKRIEQPLNLILEDKYQEAIDIFLLGEKGANLKKLPLLDPVLKLKLTNFDKEFVVEEYLNALKFLKLYSEPQMRVGVERAGEEQISFLLKILINPSDNYKFHHELILQYLNNEIKLQELVGYLTEFEEIPRQ